MAMRQQMAEKRVLTYQEALARLARYCSKAERCEQDVRRKLGEWGVESAESEQAVRWLVEQNFLNEERYVESFVREKMRINRWGARKVAFALSAKGVDGELVQRTLEAQDADEGEVRLEALLVAKRRSVKSSSVWELRQKLFRFAMSRGFESESIDRVLRRVVTERDEEEE